MTSTPRDASCADAGAAATNAAIHRAENLVPCMSLELPVDFVMSVAASMDILLCSLPESRKQFPRGPAVKIIARCRFAVPMRRFAPLFAAWSLAFAAPVHAETRALLAGVWVFGSPLIMDLKGPQNDLAAMEALVRNQGATDVTVLRNDDVSRTKFETALHALGMRARPGDWIVIYYSGHGAQAVAAVKGTRDGDHDQFLPLGRFDIDDHELAPDPERFIVDKDFYEWIARYVRSDVNVLMIADICHSGTMNRSVDPRAFRFTPRATLRGLEDELTLAARPAPQFGAVLASAGRDLAIPVDRPDLPNLVFVGAAQDDQAALENSMPDESGPSRGLLTYSLEQGLSRRGADGKSLLADLDGDGRVTVSELSIYLDGQVRTLSAQRQQPKVSYVAGWEGRQLFDHAVLGAPDVATGPARPRVFVADAKAQAMLGSPGVPWSVAQNADTADFVWDYGQRVLLRKSGDVVAEGVGGTAALRGAIEKWNAVESLRPLMNEGRGRLIVGPQVLGARYRAGGQVALSYEGRSGGAGYLTVFDLASDGTVQLLFPVTAEDGEGKLGDNGSLSVFRSRVVPPFGTDHVIAVTTPTSPSDLRAMLRTLDNQRAPLKTVEPIRRLLAVAPGQTTLSIAEIYTGN
jgi:hypothetical protein